MADECPDLKRDSTMAVTAKEGEAFLETKGKVDENAKTRAQQKEIEENANNGDETSPNKLSRTTTMAATAKEGNEIIDGEELGKTRGQTENLKESEEASEENGNEAEEQEEEEEENDEKPAIKRAGTMVVTAEEGAALLEGHDTEAGTRAEAKAVKEALEESAEENGKKEEEKEEEEKPDLKRKTTMDATVEEGQEFIKKKKESDEQEVKA